MPDTQPHIVVVIPRGEAVRNFLYSDTLRTLSDNARVTLLSVIYDEAFRQQFEPFVERIVPLQEYDEAPSVERLRKLIHEAHFRWLWSAVAANRWEVWDYRKTSDPGNAYGRFETGATPPAMIAARKAIYSLFANRPALRALTALENTLTYRQRPTQFFNELYADLQPDLVFNGSHIHGKAGFLPIRVAHQMGIPTAGFVFSWDNLTSRSRIMEPYDYYLVWHTDMRDQLLDLYPEIPADDVFVTGTPQFDFHFHPDYWLTREELAAEIGFDPERPFIFYTTGIDAHFPEEHRTVQLVIDLLDELDVPQKPQLVVRTYAKGTSNEMKALAAEGHPDVYFPPVAWDEKWYMPAQEDQSVYTSLLREAAVGINAASTVSLELMMHHTPVINLGFDPPGADIPYAYRWERHIHFDHYQPVAESGGVMVAWKPEDMRPLLERGLTQPTADNAAQDAFLQQVYGDLLDGESGCRVGERLLALAQGRSV